MAIFFRVLSYGSLDNILLLTGRTHRGQKITFAVDGCSPYAFIKNKDLMKYEQKLSRVDQVIDEDFVFIKDGEKCSTIYFKNSWDVTNNRKAVGENILHQADIPYELSIAVKHNIGRYIKIETDKNAPINIDETTGIIESEEELIINMKQSVTLPVILLDQIQEMTQEEIETIQFPPYKTAKVDIEVLAQTHEFPDENEAKEPIISIVCECDEGTDVFYLGNADFGTIIDRFYDKRATVHVFEEEFEMIATFFFHLRKSDMVLAWNSNFDYKYLINRSKSYSLEFLNWNEMQWLNLQQAVAYTQRFTTSYLSLKNIFDDLFQQKRNSWKRLPKQFHNYFYMDDNGFAQLNKESIAYKYLEIRKSQSGADVRKLFDDENHRSLLLYNCRDVWDMTALEIVGGVDGIFNLFDGLQLMRINDIFTHTLKIEPNALRFCMLNKVVSPSKQFIEGDIEQGALVHEPKIGKILNNVVMLDFSRFYISIILALEVSPENLEGNEKKLFTVLPNGQKLDEPMYFLPALSRYLIDARNDAEERKLKVENDLLKEYWKSQATSLKTLTSGLWGYISNSANVEKNQKASRYYAPHIADQILQESRRKSLALKGFIENNEIVNKKYEVVYGDTDASLIQSEEEQEKHYTEIDPEKIADDVNVFLQKISDADNYPYPILVKPELMYDRLCLVGKKYYYGRVIWEDGKYLDDPRFDIKGMQTKRGDNSQLSKDFQMQLIKNHLEYGEEGIFDTIKITRKLIMTNLKKIQANIYDEDVYYFLKSVAKPLKIRKDFKDYNSPLWKKYELSCIAWNNYVRLNNLGVDNLLQKNTTGYLLEVKFCDVDGLFLDNKYLAFSDPLLLDWNKIELDFMDILEKTIFQKIKNILKSLGFSETRIKSASKGRMVKNPFE